jgi:tetratricopeptide (TPR) repeat protein
MRNAAAVAFLAAWGATAAAQAGEGVALATLENGASIGFALVRTGGQGPGGAIGEAALPRSNSVSRVLWDRDSGAYFGYRVEVERQGGARPFRVVFKPLDRGAVERELKQRNNCPSCPAPSPLGNAGPQFPPQQQLAEGEALTLELLANPTTGERILDVVKLSLKPIDGESMRTAVSRVLEGQQALVRATAFAVRGNFSAAIDEYRKALEMMPNDASLHNKLGICYQHQQKSDSARREYERALELNPKYAEVWNNIGTLEQSRNRIRPALRAYKKAIELKPALATAWKNLGSAYLALSQFEQAFEALQEAFRLDPTILESQGAAVPAAGIDAATEYFYIAKLLASNGHLDAALDYLRRAKSAGFRDFDRVASDKAFHALVQDARYKELARR